MKDIIAEAHKSRYTVADDDPKKQGIAISESWLAELEKHPYHSSKISNLTFIEKPGTGIFLIKESSKLYRQPKERDKKINEETWRFNCKQHRQQRAGWRAI